MTKKGLRVLEALIANKYRTVISAVVVGRDTEVVSDFSGEITSLCRRHSIPCYERTEEPDIVCDYRIAVAWRWMIPGDLSKIIVLHDSLLPKYRGYAPLVNMLLNKERTIGVSAVYAAENYDTGDIIFQSSTPIIYPITISAAIDLIADNYIELLLKICETLVEGKKLTGTKQDERLASYCLWRDETDYLIDWNADAGDILHFIHTVSYPYKGAAAFINGQRKIRILDAVIERDVKIENRDTGKVIFTRDAKPVIVCGSGLIKLLQAVDNDTHENILPFKSFRIRLTGRQQS